MMHVNGSDGTRTIGRGGCHRPRPTNALLALGGWLVVSPLVLSATRVTAGVASAVTAGLALVVLAGWARAARDPVPHWLIALAFGLWLLLAPSLWEFGDGADSPGLVPIPPWQVTEPTRAMVARAEWNSTLTGLLIIALAGSVLGATRRRRGRSSSAGTEHRRQAEAPGGQR
jgi:hypothetical protein